MGFRANTESIRAPYGGPWSGPPVVLSGVSGLGEMMAEDDGGSDGALMVEDAPGDESPSELPIDAAFVDYIATGNPESYDRIAPFLPAPVVYDEPVLVTPTFERPILIAAPELIEEFAAEEFEEFVPTPMDVPPREPDPVFDSVLDPVFADEAPDVATPIMLWEPVRAFVPVEPVVEPMRDVFEPVPMDVPPIEDETGIALDPFFEPVQDAAPVDEEPEVAIDVSVFDVLPDRLDVPLDVPVTEPEAIAEDVPVEEVPVLRNPVLPFPINPFFPTKFPAVPIPMTAVPVPGEPVDPNQNPDDDAGPVEPAVEPNQDPDDDAEIDPDSGEPEPGAVSVMSANLGAALMSPLGIAIGLAAYFAITGNKFNRAPARRVARRRSRSRSRSRR